MEILRGFDGLLWHFHHLSATDLLIARHVLTAAEYMGLAVFPNRTTSWHFDDKLAQKYVLEAIKAPIPATHVFYDEGEALDWLRGAAYPLVWKLRRGAGSHNVRLVRDFAAARRLCKTAFGRGVNPVPRYFTDVGLRLKKVGGKSDFWDKLSRLPRAFLTRRMQRREAIYERGYVMFQEFIPENETDTRITVIGDRAFGFLRDVRANDFRASGSGSVCYDRTRIDPECLKVAFTVADALRAQSIALDFVMGRSGRPYVLEISYGYVPDAVAMTGGYWDRELGWHQGDYRPEDLILDDVLAAIARGRTQASSPGPWGA
jgi:glutathione synthase/RimK-type ligase-like ATP-grasp enzyme